MKFPMNTNQVYKRPPSITFRLSVSHDWGIEDKRKFSCAILHLWRMYPPNWNPARQAVQALRILVPTIKNITIELQKKAPVTIFTLCEECTYLDETWHARQSRHLVYLLPHKGYYYRLAEESSSYNFPGVPGFLFGFCVSFLIARKIYIPNIQEDKMNRHVSQD